MNLGDIHGRLSCLGMFEGELEGSVHARSSLAGANPPFWHKLERHDIGYRRISIVAPSQKVWSMHKRTDSPDLAFRCFNFLN